MYGGNTRWGRNFEQKESQCRIDKKISVMGIIFFKSKRNF
jgi:hypothetical protein